MPSSAGAGSSHDQSSHHRLVLSFDDNSLLSSLFGQHDEHLAQIETALDISLVSRGNHVAIEGSPEAIERAKGILQSLYHRLQSGLSVEPADVDGQIRLSNIPMEELLASKHPIKEQDLTGDAVDTALNDSIRIKTRRKVITPRSPAQAKYMNHLMNDEMVFGIGPAGTGKTYLPVVTAVAKLMSGEIERIILTRPAVEAGENLGFLPGDLKEKVDPYLRPLYDALHDTMSKEEVEKRIARGDIEIAPLAYMRGRTLSNAYVILDEAQNTTTMQMKMFLTRFGENSRMVIAGDPTQVDLPRNAKSGLIDAMQILRNVKGITFVKFGEADIVRHPLVGKIVHAYGQVEARQKAKTDGDNTEKDTPS